MGSKAAFLSYVDEIFERRWLSNDGPLVREFEHRIESHLGVRHCIAVTNGTVGLELAIKALDLNGEVIVPSYTFVATAHALQWQGITPVFADIDPVSHTLDVSDVERRITDKTTGIIGVHLWGNVADHEGLASLAADRELSLMFDAAHAFGVSAGGTMVGNFGRAEVLSFHATKFFNSFEGGAIVTNDDEVARRARLMRNFGFSGEDSVVYLGTNGKMTEICAAMGLVNLDSLEDFISRNRDNFDLYRTHLAGIDCLSLFEHGETVSSNFQYVVVELESGARVSRDELVDILKAHNVLARRYFWPGAHNMEPYRSIYPAVSGDLPVTDDVAERVIVLPTGTGVDEAAIITIAAIIKSALRGETSDEDQ